ncbi:adenylyl-sulfate kinase [Salinisphaera japonica]|uniref:Adenylyl-sulfate kinase n=1 Tax=Salinisphaera japonica YTM-1 TaxID=1209778 RepID=A0A423PL97_9GAMM|nr:adenylyl-sulfate kinase [Salinisphaera japonica]ROO26358.1 adenylylsulfate kinase [Salinisphaera japonica YTM-1]
MSDIKSDNIVWHQGSVDRKRREAINRHRGLTIWFTGLSGSGKSTLSVALEERLTGMGCRTYRLDGDNIRTGLNRDLAFSPDDRIENIRRIGEVASLFRDAGIINLTAFISPYRRDREMARALADEHDFVEVFVDAPLELCEQRDPKGLYAKARSGAIPNFTGISAPYEPPEQPEVHLDTGTNSLSVCVDQLVAFLVRNGYLEQSLIAAAGQTFETGA